MEDIEIKKEIQKNKRSIIIAGIFCLIIFIGYFIVLGCFYKQPFSYDSSVWGTFGDFIGGVGGTVMAFITIFLLYKSISIQLVEFSKLSRLQQKQTFDSKFFNLLGMHSDILENIQGSLSVKFENSEKRVLFGKEFIEQYVHVLRKDYKNGIELVNKSLIVRKNLFKGLLIYLKNIIDYINYYCNNENDKEHYLELLRSQISNSELIVIAYYISNDDWKNSRRYFDIFIKSKLFKYLDRETNLNFQENIVPTLIEDLIDIKILDQAEY